ncbi:MAG: ABC transporter permease [Longimicrobiales bacterium]
MFSKLTAYIRHDALTAASYKVRLLMSLGGLAVGAVPLYFVANALQPMMAPRIEGQGTYYFSFVLIGLAAQQFVMAASDALPRAISEGLRTGTLEAVFVTRTHVAVIVSGMMSFRFLWAMLQAFVLIAVGLLFGVTLAGGSLLPALFIVSLIAAAYVPFGLIAGALHLTFRSAGPLPLVIAAGSGLLGGVYYPTDVIPSWIQHVSALVPLTYGLRALRRMLLEGVGVQAVLGELMMLALLFFTLLALSVFVFHRALLHARRSGTLGQY